MKKIVSIIGTRPQILKLDPSLKAVIINTGQHLDDDMAGQHFREMKIRPKYNLGCTSDEFGKMVDLLRPVLRKEEPDVVIVYGDTYSTFAGATAAMLENIPIAHVEAGLRSHDRSMPEETCRYLTDHMATYRFAPTHQAMRNLIEEGLGNGSYHTGDTLFYSMGRFHPINKAKDCRQYIYATIHRRENLEPDALREIIEGLGKIGQRVYFPLHPHTRRIIKKNRIKIPKNIEIVKPQTRKVNLERIANSKIVVTDSGGVQREAYWLLRHSVVVRSSTEWTDIVDRGWSTLVSPNAQKIAEAATKEYIHERMPELRKRNPYEEIKAILYG